MAGNKPRVVIIGCGYAGATAARELARIGRGRVEIAACDSKPYLYNYPILPRGLAGPVPPEHINIPLEKIFRGCAVDFRGQRVTRVDARRGRVAAGGDEIGFDYLILAPGARAAPLAQDEGVFVYYPKSLEHLSRLRDTVQKIAREQAPKPHRFAIVGGGLTGVEFAAALRHAGDTACAASGVSNSRIEVHLFERGPGLVPELPPGAGKKIAGYLAGHGVHIHCAVQVERVLATHGLATSSGAVAMDDVLCCIGSRPNLRLDLMDIPADKNGLRVNDCLQLEGHENIFALGDAMTQAGKGDPPGRRRASQAIRQGRHAARNVLRLDGKRPLRRYGFHAGVTSIYLGYGTSALVWRGWAMIGKSCELVKRRLETRAP